jgi:hypothetical protein
LAHVLLAAVLLAPLLAPLAVAAHAEASPRDRAKVVIRVYEVGTWNPELTSSLAQSATRLIDGVKASVDLSFVDCALPGACVTPAPSALVLRLTQGHHPAATRQCGEATVGKNRQRGVLMTIFRACVSETRQELRAGAIAQQGIAFGLMSLSESDILAAIVVHELIHLVLPDETHGKGLFKATLDAKDWMEIAGGWPHLDSALVSRLDRALAGPPVAQGLVAAARTTEADRADDR